MRQPVLLSIGAGLLLGIGGCWITGRGSDRATAALAYAESECFEVAQAISTSAGEGGELQPSLLTGEIAIRRAGAKAGWDAASMIFSSVGFRSRSKLASLRREAERVCQLAGSLEDQDTDAYTATLAEAHAAFSERYAGLPSPKDAARLDAQADFRVAVEQGASAQRLVESQRQAERDRAARADAQAAAARRAERERFDAVDRILDAPRPTIPPGGGFDSRPVLLPEAEPETAVSRSRPAITDADVGHLEQWQVNQIVTEREANRAAQEQAEREKRARLAKAGVEIAKAMEDLKDAVGDVRERMRAQHVANCRATKTTPEGIQRCISDFH